MNQSRFPHLEREGNRRIGGPLLPVGRSPADEKVYKTTFGSVLAALRSEAAFTQVEFSIATGIKQPTLSRMERGLVLPDVYDFKLICSKLGISIGEFDDLVDMVLKRALDAASSMMPKGSLRCWGLVERDVGSRAIKGLIEFLVASLISSKGGGRMIEHEDHDKALAVLLSKVRLAKEEA